MYGSLVAFRHARIIVVSVLVTLKGEVPCYIPSAFMISVRFVLLLAKVDTLRKVIILIHKYMFAMSYHKNVVPHNLVDTVNILKIVHNVSLT